MNRKTLAFFAAAAISASPMMTSTADARMGGGFGGAHGGFGGGRMGGFGGHFGGFGGRTMGMAPAFRGAGAMALHGARVPHVAHFQGARVHQVRFDRHPVRFDRHHVRFNRQHVRFDRHHRRFVAAPFVAFPYLASYGSAYYDDCLVRVWTPWGWNWRNTCDYYGYGY